MTEKIRPFKRPGKWTGTRSWPGCQAWKSWWWNVCATEELCVQRAEALACAIQPCSTTAARSARKFWNSWARTSWRNLSSSPGGGTTFRRIGKKELLGSKSDGAFRRWRKANPTARPGGPLVTNQKHKPGAGPWPVPKLKGK